MPVSTPPVWTDPASSSVDIDSGIWTSTAIDAICSDLKVLGGADGYGGLAARPSLLVNGGFEIWQRGAGTFSTSGATTADRWTLNLTSPSTANVTEESTTVDANSQHSLRVGFTWGGSGGSGWLQQRIEDYWQLRGQTVTASVRVFTSVAGVTLQIADSGSSTAGAANTTTNAWETITCTATVSASASSLVLNVNLPASVATVYLDNAMLVVGATAQRYVPIRPADDLTACMRYYEVLATPADNSLIVGGFHQTAGGVIYTTFQYRVHKPVVPTVVVAGTWTASNTGTIPVFNSGGQDAGAFKTTITTGNQYGNLVNGGAGSTITVEAVGV